MTPSFDPYILHQASCRASLLVATAGFTADDWDDLRQEILLDYLRRAQKFDAARGEWQAFVRGVMRNQSTVLATRKYRRAGREVLLGDLVRMESRPGHEPTAILESQTHTFEDSLLLSIDTNRVLRELPAPLRRLALLLSQSPVNEVCTRTGKSRSRVYQMTRLLRDAFSRAGFRPRYSRLAGVGR